MILVGDPCFKVLDRLEEFRLKVSINKCQFCHLQVKYVNNIATTNGIANLPEKAEVVKHWKVPTHLKAFKFFPRFCNYYRRFIANYSTIICQLSVLTKSYSPTWKDPKIQEQCRHKPNHQSLLLDSGLRTYLWYILQLPVWCQFHCQDWQ